ncbi:transcription factor Opi1-domain-containing protein [Phascolomyces articulosus]|uniref:Transcription factor Opi1-domain-containing protein n=1 Tax=Phascolomyces articulosus TaxID=60185 RepID=A0AAD5PBH7_9FUNG|nr:transcription factor Opi1-domain-containing protein [Phascolomyces articulosus]
MNNNTRLRTTTRTATASRSASPGRPSPYQHPPSRSPILHHRPPPTASSTSTWQQLVVQAGSAAGTTAAVISEESMKCLKYCLSWLRYAIQHIEQQLTIVRNHLVSLATASSSSSTATTLHHQQSSPNPFSSVKKDIVETVRKVVEVISRYASTSLPQHAKIAVRGFILDLPNRWDIRSSPAASPLLTPKEGLSPVQDENAIKVLTFGTESVEMLQSISTVFSDTVDRAEIWLDRWRTVRDFDDRKKENDIQLPPIRSLNINHNPPL